MLVLTKFLRRSVFLSSVLSLSLPGRVALADPKPTLLADGRVFPLQEFAITLTPPAGWQLLPNYLGKALVMQPVVKVEKIKDYSKPSFNRNITLAVMQQAIPLDEAEALTLRNKLERDFGQAAGVTDFQIIEHRFIDYHAKADGLLIYTAFNLNGFAMSQMHIVLSGANNAVLLTYTDLADAFQKDESAMTLAWNTMLSTSLVGTAPGRYENFILPAAGLLALLGVAGGVWLLRRRSALHFYQDEEDNLYSQQDPSHSSELTDSKSASAPLSDQESDSASGPSHIWNLAADLGSPAKALVRKPKTLQTALSSF